MSLTVLGLDNLRNKAGLDRQLGSCSLSVTVFSFFFFFGRHLR